MNLTRQKPVTISAAAKGYQNALKSSPVRKTLSSAEKYEAGKNIYANKVGYMNQHGQGNYGAAEGFRAAAVPAYSALENGGAKGVADTFHSSDVSTAGKVVSDLGFDAYAEKYRDNTNKAIENTIKKANAEYESQKTAVNDDYSDLARRGYLNYMEAKKNLPQQLKAQGMTGGLSESSQVALENSYGQQVSENQRARLKALSELDAQKTGAVLDAENQRLGIENDLATMEYDKLIRELGYDRQDAQLAKQLAAQRDLQSGSQKWQSGENAQNRAHDINILNIENKNTTERDKILHGNNMEILEKEQAHESSENEKQRQFNTAISLADSGNFKSLSALTGIPEAELVQNYKNDLWWKNVYPEYAKYMFPGQSHMYYHTGGTGDTSNSPGTAPEVNGLY